MQASTSPARESLVLEALWPRYKQAGDHPRRVRGQSLRTPGSAPVDGKIMLQQPEMRRACCRVDITASVDSRALVAVHPVGVQAIKPHRSAGSHIFYPASLAPWNQAAAAGHRPARPGWIHSGGAGTRVGGRQPRSAAGRIRAAGHPGLAAGGCRRQLIARGLHRQQPGQVRARAATSFGASSATPAAIIASRRAPHCRS